jgi:hypothetical protein
LLQQQRSRVGHYLKRIWIRNYFQNQDYLFAIPKINYYIAP